MQVSAGKVGKLNTDDDIIEDNFK
ncbi:hypothetical protein KAOT1_06627 [Kordia algicida OT-1]|uniref:Uncharacterized protein n=1 Tax=Kordia algicida OT-1 TaxID=391587 RepID=A9E519_9FLAO|nr:hypothetical protein KAOT1_06627 [Kordia algicida OT-1]